MNKKKIISLCLVVVLAVTAVTGATLAYFTDTDEATNVMTYGNVAIEQHEYERKDNVAHNADADGNLQAFTQNKKVYPAVLKGENYELTKDEDNGMHWGSYVYTGTSWDTLYNDAQVANAIDKFVFVENTGSEAVYFRTIIAIECPDDMTVGHCGNGDDIGVIYGGQYDFELLGRQNGYVYYVATYKDGRSLAADKQAHPSLLQLVLNAEMTNEDVAKFGDDGFVVKVFTQACQEQGFDSMEQALSLAFDNGGELTVDAAAALFN